MVSHHPAPYSNVRLPSYSGSSAAPREPSVASRSSATSTTATRRHRHARSHYNASTSHLPQNEFPFFAHTGDVEVVLTSEDGRRENRYLLHRLILSQCSAFFEAGTRAEWTRGRAPDGSGSSTGVNASPAVAGSSSQASSRDRSSSTDAGRMTWCYALDWEAAGQHDVPMLVQKNNGAPSIFGDGNSDRPPPPLRNKPPVSSEKFFRSMADLSTLSMRDRPSPTEPPTPGEEVLKDYDNLFRTMYQFPPNLDSVNIASAYTECKALLHLADMYDALEVVGHRVDNHMLRFGSRLFKQIAKYPPSYLKLGYLARSEPIFAEALVHVVGQWPLAAPLLRGQVDPPVMDLIEDKVDELREIEERVESKLWRVNLTTNRGERVTPNNDFLSWLAVSLFRSWLAENTTPTPTGILKDHTHSSSSRSSAPLHTRSNSRASSSSVHHIASQRTHQQAPPPSQPPPIPPGSNPFGRIYRLLGSTDTSLYLTREDLKRFLKAPGSASLGSGDFYTRDNLRRFERKIDMIKNLSRDAVQPLMRNFLQLDLRDFGPAGLGYLTCTKVERRDLPW